MIKPYYEKPEFTLYKANCLDVLSELPEESVDMIFADPPYFLSSGSFTCQNGKMTSVKKGDWDMWCNTVGARGDRKGCTDPMNLNVLTDLHW